MARVSTTMETQKWELKTQLREAKYVDLNVHVAAGRLQKLRLIFFGKKVKSSSTRTRWVPVGQ